MIPVLLPAVASLSAYTTYVSIRSILNVRTYEEKTEKAAKWSGTVEDQLWQTRKTEAAGLLAVSPPSDEYEANSDFAYAIVNPIGAVSYA